MWTALLSPYAVGIVRWRSPRPCLTVVVKRTLSLARSGPAELAPTQLGLARDATFLGHPGAALEHASDFAPRKARADVLLVGHARAAAPSTNIGVVLETGEVHKAVDAQAGAAARAIPLAETHLRRGGLPVRTGPRPTATPPWDAGPLPPDFDFTQCNVAPDDQQTSWLSPGQRLVLAGVLASAARREVELPRVVPVVGYFAGGVEHGAAREIQMVADTLWIHTDDELYTVCWRGVLERVPARSTAERLVVVDSAGSPTNWAALRHQMPAARWTRAVTLPDIPEGPPARWPLDSPPLEPHDLERAGGASAPDDDDDDEQPTVARVSLADDTSSAPLASSDHDRSTNEAGHATDDEPAPTTPRAGLMLGQRGLGAALGGVALCSPDARSNPLPYRSASRTAPPASPAPPTRVSTGTVPPPAPNLPSPATRIGTGTAPPPAPNLPSPATRVGTGTAPPPAPNLPSPATRVGTGTAPPPAPNLPSPATRVGTGTAPPPAPNLPSPAIRLGTGTAPPPAAIHAWPAPRIDTGTAPPPARVAATGSAPSSTTLPRIPPPPALPVLDRSHRMGAGAAPGPHDVRLPAAPFGDRDGAQTQRGFRAPTLSVTAHATVVAQLQQSHVDRAMVLSQHGLDERSWRAAERALASQIAQERRNGPSSSAARLTAALAVLRVERPQPSDEEIDRFVELKARIDWAPNPKPILAQAGLSADEWSRRQRAWQVRCRADRTLDRRVRDGLADHRASRSSAANTGGDRAVEPESPSPSHVG